jgi:hypothetical protein
MTRVRNVANVPSVARDAGVICGAGGCNAAQAGSGCQAAAGRRRALSQFATDVTRCAVGVAAGVVPAGGVAALSRESACVTGSNEEIQKQTTRVAYHRKPFFFEKKNQKTFALDAGRRRDKSP